MHDLLCLLRKASLLAIFFLIFIYYAIYQKTFRDAYVLKTKTDTLYGEINNKNII